MTHFADLVRMRLISQLIRDISRVLQKLLKCIDGTDIFAFIILSKSLDLNFNNSEPVIESLDSCLQN